jgi:hypothetical protein
MTYIQRDISGAVLKAARVMPVVVITGMRQTGKSTFLRNQPALKQYRYITLDSFAQLAAARENPLSFVDTGERLIIDEAQRCPELFIAVKQMVDRKRIPGQFILSGSANFLLMKNISESLAGRASYITMNPFTRREILKLTGQQPFIKAFFHKPGVSQAKLAALLPHEDIVRGSMPPVVTGDAYDRDIWFTGYEKTYIERDIRELSRIGDIIAFRTLLHLVALRTGTVLSISSLARDAKLKTQTTSNYLSLMEISCVLYRLHPFLGNRASRLIKAPKIYIGDSGLACFLSGLRNLSEDIMKGTLAETYVAQNLQGIIEALWPEARLYFWNIQGRHEVDFIIEAGNETMAIEVKASERWQRKDLAGLKSFLALTPGCRAGILAYNGEECIKLGNKLWAIPISQLII